LDHLTPTGQGELGSVSVGDPVALVVSVSLAVIVAVDVAVVIEGGEVPGGSDAVGGAVEELDWTDAPIGSHRSPLLISHWIGLPSADTPVEP
jgi:hypothetical protein